MRTKAIELFDELQEIVGVSGNEKYLSKVLSKHYEELADDVIYDNLGSIFAVKYSREKNAPNVMITGHLDEPGFIVIGLQESGFIQALSLGTIAHNSLLGCPLTLVTRTGQNYKGTLVYFDDKETIITKKNHVLVDIGAASKQELLEMGIKLGDTIGFNSENFLSNNDNRLFGKALNSHYSCVLGIDLLREVKDFELEFNLYVGATVQEEVGFRGAQTATNLVKPDLAICLDTLPAMENKATFERQGFLGKGLLVVFYEKTILPNRALVSNLRNICNVKKINYQDYYSLGSSDAGWIHKLRQGAPTLFLAIPIRNIDAPISVIDLRDYDSACDALVSIIKELTTERIQQFKEENR